MWIQIISDRFLRVRQRYEELFHRSAACVTWERVWIFSGGVKVQLDCTWRKRRDVTKSSYSFTFVSFSLTWYRYDHNIFQFNRLVYLSRQNLIESLYFRIGYLILFLYRFQKPTMAKKIIIMIIISL